MMAQPGPTTGTSEHPDSYNGVPGKTRKVPVETKIIDATHRKDGPRGPNKAPDSYSE
jgi:hypothetical protein